MRLAIVAILDLHEGKQAAFQEFEARAEGIMARHDGRIESRVRSGLDREIHVVTFPDRESFERYRSDPDTRALAERRATLVRRTGLWVGSGHRR